MATAQDIFAFRAQFSEFAEVTDADVAMVLNTADIFLDPGAWDTDTPDYQAARRYFAAHMLSLLLTQKATAAMIGTGAGGGWSNLYVRSISIGERRVMFGERQSFAKRQGESLGPGDEM